MPLSRWWNSHLIYVRPRLAGLLLGKPQFHPWEYPIQLQALLYNKPPLFSTRFIYRVMGYSWFTGGTNYQKILKSHVILELRLSRFSSASESVHVKFSFTLRTLLGSFLFTMKWCTFDPIQLSNYFNRFGRENERDSRVCFIGVLLYICTIPNKGLIGKNERKTKEVTWMLNFDCAGLSDGREMVKFFDDVFLFSRIIGNTLYPLPNRFLH